ncbi:helix-turn-helix domain-containing protein [Paenibacillus sp. P36]|uniref:helix-turn-helix domain-containing protein n=1 Tax=Paenibacillus sp. P36 TaxID=3342538 RepID=UPI0038B3DFA8
MNESEYYKFVGDQIRKKRLLRNKTQMQISHSLKISRPSLANIEAGRQRIHLFLLHQISNELEVTIYELLLAK